MFVVAKRIIKQIIHDKRSRAIIVVAPIMLITLVFLLLGKSDYRPTVALDKDAFSAEIAGLLENGLKDNPDIIFSLLPENTSITQYVEDKKADAVITVKDNNIDIVMLEMVAGKINIVQTALKDAVPKAPQSLDINLNIIFGSTAESTFDSLAYFMLSVLSFFLIFIFAGISFVRERTQGTLERLMRTPIKSSSILIGYTMGFGFFAVIQSVLMILYSKFVLNTLFVGEWWRAMLIMLIIATIAVLMGIFVSVISKSEFQVMQFIPVLIVPQIFFSGLIPVDMLPYHLNYISYIMPLYYGGMALKYVMVFGYDFMQILPYILTMFGFIVLFFIANLLAIRKSRCS